MLTIKDLCIQYAEQKAVDNITIDIEQGKISGLIGPNGAGKSSLIKACVGMISEYSGEILYENKPLHKNRHWIKEHCGYAPEDTVLLPYLKGREFLELIGTLRKSSDLDKEIKDDDKNLIKKVLCELRTLNKRPQSLKKCIKSTCKNDKVKKL